MDRDVRDHPPITMLRNTTTGAIVCQDCANAEGVETCSIVVWNPCIYGPDDAAHFKKFHPDKSYFTSQSRYGYVAHNDDDETTLLEGMTTLSTTGNNI
jgi:hypothetical protein